MNRLFQFKRTTVLLGILLSFAVGMPSVAAAYPLVVPPHYAVLTIPGETRDCTLPTGQAGALQSDGLTCCPVGTTSSNNSCLFAKYINPLIDLLSAAVAVVAVIAIIIGGIEYSTSAGDPQKAATGKQHIVSALIGLLAYLLLYVFLQFILPGGLIP